jgi:hypothetical protein
MSGSSGRPKLRHRKRIPHPRRSEDSLQSTWFYVRFYARVINLGMSGKPPRGGGVTFVGPHARYKTLLYIFTGFSPRGVSVLVVLLGATSRSAIYVSHT